MNLMEHVDLMREGTKHYKLIVLNQNSLKCMNECNSFNDSNIKKININQVLVDILKGKSDEEKSHEVWDITKEYLNSFKEDILMVYNVDYMFSPELGNLDVINNFKYYSRCEKIIFLIIDAKLIGNNLIYSEEGWDDYKKMDISEVQLVGWGNED